MLTQPIDTGHGQAPLKPPLRYEGQPAVWVQWAMNRIRDQAIEHDLREAGICFMPATLAPVHVRDWDSVTTSPGAAA